MESVEHVKKQQGGKQLCQLSYSPEWIWKGSDVSRGRVRCEVAGALRRCLSLSRGNGASAISLAAPSPNYDRDRSPESGLVRCYKCFGRHAVQHDGKERGRTGRHYFVDNWNGWRLNGKSHKFCIPRRKITISITTRYNYPQEAT